MKCLRTGTCKRIMTFLLAVTMSLTGFATFSTVSVEAKATPKLSDNYVTIAKGGSQTIKLKKGKGSWAIKKNGVARIKSKTKSSVTITPVKPGNTVVTCKVGKKKLTCKVRVLNNKVGRVEDMNVPALIVGKKRKDSFTLEEGVTFKGCKYNKKIGRVSTSTKKNPDTGETTLNIKIRPIKPGRFKLKLYFVENGKTEEEITNFVFINGFRGKAKVKKTDANYKAWRKKTIATMAKSDMTTWELVNAIGSLISTGKYSSKGGATGKQLWYGGNGTCVSGAQMMHDFMKDIGVPSKIQFMGNKFGAQDIYGFSIMYMSQHKNTWIRLGGKRYELNPQPGMMWPVGTVKR